ncbi:MAG: hypothetical protein J0I06_12495 [Planctomycetes bacterium]|nr:hypothetical protein [Planctomycetota bacterium]
METKRLQVDLTEKEHTEMERLAAMAGLKTKREFVVNALTLFRWAANELAAGRHVGSFAPGGGHVKQLEMPCLQPFVQLSDELDRASPTAEELQARAKRPGIPAEQVLAEMRKLLEANRVAVSPVDRGAEPVGGHV